MAGIASFPGHAPYADVAGIASGKSAAFLVSQYPSVSHTFVLREIVGLRALGLRIDVASINAPDRAYPLLSQMEQEESRKTFYVKKAGVGSALRAHVETLFLRPRGYLQGLRFAAYLAWSNPLRIGYGFYYFTEGLMLGRWMKQGGLEHLHVHFCTAASTVGLFTAKTFGVGYSLTVHGPDEFYDVQQYCLPAKFRAAYFISCIGNYAKSQVMRLTSPPDWGKIHVVPLGVDPEEFRPRQKSSDSGKLELLCVGRLVAAKGQAVLIEAARLLVLHGVELSLRLVGDGPLRQELAGQIREAGLEDSVSLEGAINPDRIRDYLEQTDLFILASFAEGIPVALMEAMAMEIPCISTFVNGIPELIDHRVSGWLVPPANPGKLADAIVELHNNPSLRRQLGVAGRQKVLEHYHLGRNHEVAVQIFNERLGTSSAWKG